jgi:Protein of unknown function (DUF3048) N-terminal domain/Protein of unknown function (DUF3048) C-terminal domain
MWCVGRDTDNNEVTMKRSAGLLACVAIMAGCSGGGSGAQSTTSTAVASTSSTTVATTTTTAATTTIAPTTVPAPKPMMPLTGLPVTDADAAKRPAIVAKIDNSNSGEVRPQLGLDEADVVFEEIVEGITRFAAVFHSTLPDEVGPIRSARTSDIDIIGQLNKPILVWSGGNDGVTSAMGRANIFDAGQETGDRDVTNNIYFRTNKRVAPHNLIAKLPEALAAAATDGKAPGPLFAYRKDGVAAGGVPVANGIDMLLSSTRVSYEWNGAGWARMEYGVEHENMAGEQIAPANVVILITQYRRSPADPKSPEAITVGSGEAMVLTAGNLITGTWKRETADKPATLTDTSGKTIELTPGRTWVELPDSLENVQVRE